MENTSGTGGIRMNPPQPGADEDGFGGDAPATEVEWLRSQVALLTEQVQIARTAAEWYILTWKVAGKQWRAYGWEEMLFKMDWAAETNGKQ